MSNSINEYTKLRVIGNGSFGTCYKVLKRETGEIFVWKAVQYGKMSEEKKKLLVNEVNLLSGLNHPNIVKYFDRIIHKPTNTIYIVMEWCAGGDLSTLVNQCRKVNINLDEKFIWRVLYQLAQALHICHMQMPEGPVLHRDIKPANVFLDGNGNVKLGDFGLAYLLEEGKTSVLSGVVGTPFYLSPEAIQDGHYNEKSDIWSLGCLIYELCALRPPFDGSNLRTLIQCIQAGRFDRIPQSYSENLQNIINYMLTVENLARPTVDNILHHPEVIVHVVQGSLEGVEYNDRQSSSDTNVQSQETSIKIPCSCGEEIAKLKDSLHQKLNKLKMWESVLKVRELEIANKEKAVTKREKKISVLELSIKEKVMQAELYLQYSQTNRGNNNHVQRSQSASRVKANFPVYEEDGDTSMINPTSAKLDPKNVEKPRFFTRIGSEKRVHFGTLPTRKVQFPVADDNFPCCRDASINHLLIDGYRVNDAHSNNIKSLLQLKLDGNGDVKSIKSKKSHVVDRCSSSSSGVSNPNELLLPKNISENHLLIDGYHVKETNSTVVSTYPQSYFGKNEKVKCTKSKRSSVVVDGSSNSSSGLSYPNDHLSLDEERKRWLEQKRASYWHSNKENVPVNNINGCVNSSMKRLNKVRKGDVLSSNYFV